MDRVGSISSGVPSALIRSRPTSAPRYSRTIRGHRPPMSSSRTPAPAPAARARRRAPNRALRDSRPTIAQGPAVIVATGADIRIGGGEAFYHPILDYVQLPPVHTYFEPINWYRTVFHELGHRTGHPSRLNRDQSGAFGSSADAREELVAEMAGAFVCASLGVTPTVRHADYIGSWLEVIREDNRAITRAASAASKAADHILQRQEAQAPSAAA